MTKRTVVLVHCDLPHEEEVPAITVSFIADGERDTVEVDICQTHYEEVFGPLVKIGRVLKRPGRKPAATR